MQNLKIALNTLAPEGLSLTVNDPDVWSNPLQEFHLPVKLLEPIYAQVQVIPQEDGCLMRGKIEGKVALPCDRCTEDAIITIEQKFDEFEVYPDFHTLDNNEGDDTVLDSPLITLEKSGYVLDVGALLWEEFALALPIKPLCSPQCKGICPRCGINFNIASCGCAVEDGDPRLAALRGLKIKQ